MQYSKWRKPTFLGLLMNIFSSSLEPELQGNKDGVPRVVGVRERRRLCPHLLPALHGCLFACCILVLSLVFAVRGISYRLL